MKTFEVNGNLRSEKGLGGSYKTFSDTVGKVRNFFIKYLGDQLMNSLDLYVDNATKNSGNTPKIMPVLEKYLIIKLGITPKSGEARIAFQFAHELMHFVYYVKYGIDKKMADDQEETICTAASLIVVHNLYPKDFDRCNNYVKSLTRLDFRKGAEVAEEIEYQFEKLVKKI